MADVNTPFSTISLPAKRCDKTIFNLYQDIKSSSMFYKNLNNLENSMGRFRVWAKNVGAFDTSSKRSLDSRLNRDGDEMREAVMDNLASILRSAHRGLSQLLSLDYIEKW
jgi:hypothetical protein